MFSSQLNYFKLFELFRVFASNIAVEVFSQNDDFDLLLDINYFLDQLKQLILVACILDEIASGETDKSKGFKLCDVSDYALFSWVRALQV